MGGVDAIIFTAGVGEHQASVRYDVLHGLESLGKGKDRRGQEQTQIPVPTRLSRLPTAK